MYEKKEFTLTKINSIGSFEIRLKVARLENPSETIKKSDKDSTLENKFWETANNSKNKNYRGDFIEIEIVYFTLII